MNYVSIDHHRQYSDFTALDEIGNCPLRANLKSEVSNSFSGVRPISGGVLSRLFPGRARGQAAARGRGAPSPRHPCSTFRRPGKRITYKSNRRIDDDGHS